MKQNFASLLVGVILAVGISSLVLHYGWASRQIRESQKREMEIRETEFLAGVQCGATGTLLTIKDAETAHAGNVTSEDLGRVKLIRRAVKLRGQLWPQLPAMEVNEAALTNTPAILPANSRRLANL